MTSSIRDGSSVAFYVCCEVEEVRSVKSCNGAIMYLLVELS